MQDDVADHHRAVRLDLPGVGLGLGAVDDGDAASADDLEHAVGPDHARGVLVDADAEQRRVLGDDRQQPTESVSCLEVLVDDHAGQDAQAGRHLDHALLGRRATCAECDHVRAHRGGACARASHYGAFAVTPHDRLGERGAADRRRQAQLVAAGQEDARRVANDARRVGVVGLRSGGRVDRVTSAAPSSPKTRRYISPASGPSDEAVLITAIRASAATGQLDEASQDHPLPDLVFRATDDDDVPLGHPAEYATLAGDRYSAHMTLGRGIRMRAGGGAQHVRSRRTNGAPPSSLRRAPWARLRATRSPPHSGLPNVACSPSRPDFCASRGVCSRSRCSAITGGLVLAFLYARGELAGSDAYAYWTAVQRWLAGEDIYQVMPGLDLPPAEGALPYAYAPWSLYLFLPWALLPWDIAWIVWRVGATSRSSPCQSPGRTTAGRWARPLLVALLGPSLAANLDTGNINVFIALAAWVGVLCTPGWAAGSWAIGTALKFVPAAVLLFIPRRAWRPASRSWPCSPCSRSRRGPRACASCEIVLDYPRPLRIDYLMLAWAVVPWLWARPWPPRLTREWLLRTAPRRGFPVFLPWTTPAADRPTFLASTNAPRNRAVRPLMHAIPCATRTMAPQPLLSGAPQDVDPAQRNPVLTAPKDMV